MHIDPVFVQIKAIFTVFKKTKFHYLKKIEINNFLENLPIFYRKKNLKIYYVFNMFYVENIIHSFVSMKILK